MKVTPFLLIIFIGIIGCQQTDPPAKTKRTNSTGYSEVLAKETGADQYGMKKYVIAFLKTGPNRDLPKDKATQLQKAHMENIGKLAKAGKLVVAGPFLDQGDLRGIYIFNVESVDEAKTLTETDPAIKAGSLVMELKSWYGSAALMKVNELHKQLAKVEF